jgi:Helix-turn-helix domain
MNILSWARRPQILDVRQNGSGPRWAWSRHAAPWASLQDGIYRWRAENGGVPPARPNEEQRSNRYLSLLERQRIATLQGHGLGVREIARRIGRSSLSVSAGADNAELARRTRLKPGVRWLVVKRTVRPESSEIARFAAHRREDAPIAISEPVKWSALASHSADQPRRSPPTGPAPSPQVDLLVPYRHDRPVSWLYTPNSLSASRSMLLASTYASILPTWLLTSIRSISRVNS